jgi:hypothetical protein
MYINAICSAGHNSARPYEYRLLYLTDAGWRKVVWGLDELVAAKNESDFLKLIRDRIEIPHNNP